MKNLTHHACAVCVQEKGVLLEGAARSGKTSLAAGIVERGSIRGWKAGWVGDDRIILTTRDNQLFAAAPDALAGKIELSGYGITEVPFVDEVAVHLVVKLVDDQSIERMPDEKWISREGIDLPLLEVPVRHEEQAARIVLAWLQDRL